MEFAQLTPHLASEWDALVNASPEGWAFSSSGWLGAMARVWDLTEHSFGIMHNGELVAIMPLQSMAREHRLSSGGWGHGGPALLPGLGEKQRRRLLRSMYQRVMDTADEISAHQVTISLSPLTRASLENRWGVNPLIMHGFSDVSTHSRLVDLSANQEQVWLGLSQDSRQQIKKARKAGYEVRAAEWDSMLEDYYRVHVENYARTDINAHPKAYFQAMGGLPPGTSALWAGCDPQGRAVAFHNDIRHAGASMYHVGCCVDDHLDSGINYLLMWESLMAAKRDGCRWYEVGEVYPNASAGKEQSLSVFKSKFGGDIHRVFRGRIVLKEPPEEAVPVSRIPAEKLTGEWKTLTRELLSRLGAKLRGPRRGH